MPHLGRHGAPACHSGQWVREDVRMITSKPFTIIAIVAAVVSAGMANPAGAAQCGSTAAGFEAWKPHFADEARARGVSAASIAALMGTTYATATIAADRSQRSFRLSFDQFLAK